ncbi:hypothetical protein [Methyloglobulus sp.]|uniref:hypothetical protein n=1 Tax=Methyloglobulus sp. TaxID=2518622 RepID=UPI0039897AD3
MTALSKVRDSGFAVTLVDGYIEISPSSKLTPTQREFLKRHKAAIVAALEAETYPKQVTCHTPNGKAMQVLAEDAEHGAFLLRMNPPQCGNCTNFKPHHEHRKGSGTCAAGVMPSGIVHWSGTRHTCDRFKPKESPC